jgi:hypothetical protein
MQPQGPPPGSGGSGIAASLAEALAGMAWEVEPGRFALVGFPGPPGTEDLAALRGAGPAQAVREGGETTLLLDAADLEAVAARHPGARVERDLRWIRFRTSMGWEVTGFLAHVTGALAAAGVPLGAVCGFSRDHLFVAEPHLARARGVLEGLFGPAAAAPPEGAGGPPGR